MNPATIISLVFSGVMMLIGVSTFIITQVKSGKKDTADSIAELSSLREGILKANLKLDTVCNTMNDIKTDIKAMDKKLTEHSETIAVLKRDLETAFIRIDELREGISKVKGEQ